MTAHPDLFAGRCVHVSATACMGVEGGLLCSCSLVVRHGGPCKCGRCGLLFEGEVQVLVTPPPRDS